MFTCLTKKIRKEKDKHYLKIKKYFINSKSIIFNFFSLLNFLFYVFSFKLPWYLDPLKHWHHLLKTYIRATMNMEIIYVQKEESFEVSQNN